MQRHRKNLLYGAYVVAIVILIVVIILLLSPKASAPTNSHSKASTTSQSENSSKSKTGSVATNQTSKTTGSQTADSSAPKLSNTGPGNDIALFAVSAAVFSTLHWTIRRHKLASSMIR